MYKTADSAKTAVVMIGRLMEDASNIIVGIQLSASVLYAVSTFVGTCSTFASKCQTLP